MKTLVLESKLFPIQRIAMQAELSGAPATVVSMVRVRAMQDQLPQAFLEAPALDSSPLGGEVKTVDKSHQKPLSKTVF